MGKSIKSHRQPSGGPSLLRAGLRRTTRAVMRQLRDHQMLWISLSVFLLFAWLISHTTCVFRATIGIPCPGCGLSRSFSAALRGNWQLALQQHPLFWLVPLILLLWAGTALWAKKPRRAAIMNRIIIGFGFIFFVVYIYRMLTLFPHTEPMTYNQASFTAGFLRLAASLWQWLVQMAS